jgi:hypothetical protein
MSAVSDSTCVIICNPPTDLVRSAHDQDVHAISLHTTRSQSLTVQKSDPNFELSITAFVCSCTL